MTLILTPNFSLNAQLLHQDFIYQSLEAADELLLSWNSKTRPTPRGTHVRQLWTSRKGILFAGALYRYVVALQEELSIRFSNDAHFIRYGHIGVLKSQPAPLSAIHPAYSRIMAAYRRLDKHVDVDMSPCYWPEEIHKYHQAYALRKDYAGLHLRMLASGLTIPTGWQILPFMQAHAKKLESSNDSQGSGLEHTTGLSASGGGGGEAPSPEIQVQQEHPGRDQGV